MMLKEELLSYLLFPEDQGNCMLQTGTITYILERRIECTSGIFDQLSIQQFYSLAWVLCLVRFVIGASNYAFMNVIKNTTITHVSVFQALFSRFLYLSTSEGHIKPTNPRYKSVSFVLYSLRKIVLLKHRFTIPCMLWSNSTLGPHLPCWRIWTDGDCELYLTHHK